MSAIRKSVIGQPNGSVNAAFMKFLPVVQTHAAIQFRRLSELDREEAVAEAVAGAFVNVHAAFKNGRAHRLTPGTVARYAVLHVRDGAHVGGSSDSKCDAMSFKAQRRRGFAVRRLGWADLGRYDCINDPATPVYRRVLIADRRSPVPDQAAFRLDWSEFLAGQTDRTRTVLSLFAEGHRQIDIAERLGLTPSAVGQRRKRAKREWERMQREADDANAADARAERN